MAVTINASTSSGVITTADNSGVLQLQTNSGQTAVTIDTSQNVGIGTTSPTALGAGRTSVNINGTTDSILWLGSNGTYTGYAQATSSLYTIVGNSVPLLLQSTGANYTAISTNGSERMRIDSSGNLLFNSGYGSVATAYGCRAWVNFDGTDTTNPVTINGSANVSSVTYVSAGNYNVNFTTAMPDAAYSAICGTAYSGQGDMPGADTFATGSLKVRGRNVGGTALLRNPTCVHVFR